MNRNSGFTLAETLITLSIIGVIAAITIPTLVKNNEAAQLKTGFWVANSIMKNTEGALSSQGIILSELSVDEIASNFKSTSSKEIQYSKNTYRTYLGTREASGAAASRLVGMFTLKNSMTGLIIRPLKGFPPDTMTLIGIDINGFDKKPNRYGHDVFFWYQSPETNQIYITGSPQAKKELNSYHNSCNLKTDTCHENGIGCGINAINDINYFKNLPK